MKRFWICTNCRCPVIRMIGDKEMERRCTDMLCTDFQPPIMRGGLYQQPKQMALDEWKKTLYEQHNIAVYQSGYMNEIGKEKCAATIREIVELLDKGEILCPVSFRKKHKIFEFKHKGREFVQLELF